MTEWNPMAQQYTPATSLSDFLLARIAEDDAVARKVAEMLERDSFGTEGSEWYANAADSSADPIVAMGPTRALAECEAKRRIVDLHGPDIQYSEGHCGTCWNDTDVYCPTLRLLALPYADHPDYREEWRP